MFHHPWQFLVIALAGFINRQQQDLLAYLQEENAVLREKPRGNARITPAAIPCSSSSHSGNGITRWQEFLESKIGGA